MLARFTRRVALKLAEQPAGAAPGPPINVAANALTEWLGPEHFMPEEVRRQLPPGVATGLAWTPTGGDVLYVETTLLPGSRKRCLPRGGPASERVLLPQPNAKDLREVPEEVRNELDLILIETIDEGLQTALEVHPAAAARAAG